MFVRTRHLLIALFGLALVLAACSNNSSQAPDPTGQSSVVASAPPTSATATAVPSDQVTPTPSSTATATPTPSRSVAASPTASPSAAPSAIASAPSSADPSSTPSASAVACEPEAPTSTSAGWSTLQAHDTDFSFEYPADWDKIYGAFVFNTSSLLDPKTFAETGLPATSETRADLVRAPGVGLPNASVLIVPGVTSNTATVFQRQLARFGTIPDIKVVSSGLTACIGGQQALGVAFTFNKDTTYQESWYVVRGGRSYDFQWLAPKGQEATDQFREMFRTWQWGANVPVATPLPHPSGAASPAPSGSAMSSFVLAGITTKVDSAATSANPKDFVTTVPKAATAIYSVFALKPGLSGQVNGALKQGDKVVVTLSLQYGSKNSWGDFRINSANGIAPGSYTMVITFVPNGETINLPFTVK
jgi:hypothetical protein